MLITYCSKGNTKEASAPTGPNSDTYILHRYTPWDACGSQLTMDFQPNGKVTFRIKEGPTAGHYFCPVKNTQDRPSSYYYLTHRAAPCDFDYIYAPNSVWQATYYLGYQGHAMRFNDQDEVDYCDVATSQYVIIDENVAMKDTEVFNIVNAPTSNDRQCPMPANNNNLCNNLDDLQGCVNQVVTGTNDPVSP